MRLTRHPARPTTPHRSPPPRTSRRAQCGHWSSPAQHVAPFAIHHPSQRRTRDVRSPPVVTTPSTWRLLVVIELAVLAVLVSASTAHAETTQVLALVGSIDQVLTNIRTWVMGILASLATVFLSIGGVRYVMGGGNPGEIEKAKTAFKSAAIGYGLAALAPLVVTVLQGIVGA